ncbi:hypothetical protein PENPOL_c002G08998 [Penicillium polonicum]|uniref:Epidermal growth factor receptor-like transmembrane-juxtamembrane segment domain-containing protein n=1 Tax=Penicillium polonicum TaxID=60169 RepID=A0A1V6NY22_PENPO|nr:hypothetical protein PENPOL_c002G08998 [Penicillium polonicum]
MVFEMESLESLESIIPRDSNTCTGTKQWYVCTAGNFRGCCSSDPCTTGICPGDSDDDTLSLTTAGVIGLLPNVTPRTTTTSSTSTLSGSTTVLSTDPSTTASPPSSTASITTETPAGLETPNTPSAPSSNLGAIIGGVVGGIAVLVICAVLLFCCCRRKREYGKREKGSTLVSWYPSRLKRKYGANAVEMKGALSPSDSETNNSLSAVSPFATDNIRGSIILTPDLALGSSSTGFISHSPHKTPPVPPTKSHSSELIASVPPRQGFTPELPDTCFQRLRAELASYSQSELINVPMEQRQRLQNHTKSRTSPRAWESPALAPIPSSRASSARGAGNGSGHSHSNSNGSSPGRNQAGRVITAEGVVLGANLDRYSNGMEIGDSQAQGERGRKAERGETDHVMSFMQYAGRPEDRGLENGLGITTSDHTSNLRGRGGGASRSRPRPVERSLEDDIAAAEGNVDVPPAYEAEEGAPGHEIKSPSGRMGISPRGGI